MKIKYGLLPISLFVSVLTADPISEESGFSGYISAGATGLEYKSNMVAGNALDKKISDNRITNLHEKASRESTVIPSFDFNFKYTFASSQTELFLGTDLEDLLTFDGVTKFGARRDFNDLGIIGAGLLFTTLPATVWKDPYNTTYPRNHADQSSRGLAFTWEDIAGSKFGLEVRLRKYEIDGGDKSGLTAPYAGEFPHGLTNLQLNDQLDREGDSKMLIATYHWKINDESHLKPSLRYTDYDLDGQAMQYKRTALKLDYLKTAEKWSFIVGAIIGQDDYDHINPLFPKEADSTMFGANFTVGYKNPFDWSKKLSLLATLSAYENDSDINFYDTTITMANLMFLYRF